MSFMNVAKAGVENFSKYGKFIGEGKNNGIKVYEAVKGDGAKVLSSLNKDGELIKTITKDPGHTRVIHLDGTAIDINKSVYSVGGDKGYAVKFDFWKRYPTVDSGVEYEQIIRTYSHPGLANFHLGGKNSENVVKLMRSPKAKESVVLYQRMANGSRIFLTRSFPRRAEIRVEGYYKLTPDITLEDGRSIYRVDSNEKLIHADSNNRHDQNLAQMLFDSAKKIWR